MNNGSLLIDVLTDNIDTPPPTTGEPPGPQYLPPASLEYLYFSIHLVLFLVSLIGNSLAMLSLITASSQFYIWLFNLVTADLLKTAVCMPYSLYIIWNYKDYRKFNFSEPPFCTIEGAIFMICLLVSLLSNIAIAIDRVIAITVPIFYARIQRRQSPVVVIGATWISVILVAVLPPVLLKKRGYMYNAFVPNCSLELHNMVATLPGVNGATVRVVVGILYSILFGLPILIVCISCAIVTIKLFKQTLRTNEKKTNCSAAPASTSRVLSNRDSVSTVSGATHTTKLTVTRVSLDHSDQHSQVSVLQQSRTPSRTPSPILRGYQTHDPQPMKLEKLQLDHQGEEPKSYGDKLELLHNPQQQNLNKQGSLLRRRKLQKRAGLTMTLVASTFFLCHICLFSYWAFYDMGIYAKCTHSGKSRPDKDWSYGVCVTFHTGLITLVYLNAPLNVAIYYYRCSYLRQRMLEFITLIGGVLCFPCIFTRRIANKIF